MDRQKDCKSDLQTIAIRCEVFRLMMNGFSSQMEALEWKVNQCPVYMEGGLSQQAY